VTTPVYAWRDLRFSTPAGWRDDTLVTLTAPGAALNLTVSRDALGGDLLAWSRAQENALAAQRPTGYRAVSLEKVTIGAHAAVVAERELVDGNKAPLVQRQAFVALGGEVIIVTATARRSERAAAHAAVDTLVASLSSSSSGARP
jgi:hypothetical protein